MGHAGRKRAKVWILRESIQTWLVVKECHLESAKEIFKDTGVHVTTDGKVYLGSFIGPDHMKDVFVQGKVDSWLAELEELSSIAVTQPHAAFIDIRQHHCAIEVGATHLHQSDLFFVWNLFFNSSPKAIQCRKLCYALKYPQ